MSIKISYCLLDKEISKNYGYHFHPLVQFVQFTCEQIYRVINCQIFYKAEKTNVERAALVVAQVF